MLQVTWLKEAEFGVGSLLDTQNKLSLTTSLAHKLCSLKNNLQGKSKL